ncbi:MAG TPA: pyridoxamine 5'-phosphate oxidase family protein [Actinomycetota bacterium]|jgi:hypothetical protein
MRWDAFASACPELAELALDRLRAHELCMLGTLRADGSPRITPCEFDLAAGELMLGMMWRSRKAVDLLRDPRCVVHSCTSDRMGTEGDAKLYGRAVPVEDAGRREAYRDAIRRRIDWAPDEPEFHLFALDVTSAGFITFAEPRRVLSWTEAGGLRELPHPG